MLSADHRLTEASLFRAATRRGVRCGSATVVVHLLPGDRPGPTQVGFVVSKAVGGATTRNRVKRRLRHLAREHVSLLPGAAVLVVRALPAAAAASYAELGDDLASCLDRALDRSGDPVPA